MNDYTKNGIDAAKFMEETENLSNTQYQRVGIAAEHYMEETSRLASIAYQG